MLDVAPPRSLLYHMEGQNESYKRLQFACFHIFNRVFNRRSLRRFGVSFATHGVENVSGEALDVSASNFALTVVAVTEHKLAAFFDGIFSFQRGNLCQQVKVGICVVSLIQFQNSLFSFFYDFVLNISVGLICCGFLCTWLRGRQLFDEVL